MMAVTEALEVVYRYTAYGLCRVVLFLYFGLPASPEDSLAHAFYSALLGHGGLLLRIL